MSSFFWSVHRRVQQGVFENPLIPLAWAVIISLVFARDACMGMVRNLDERLMPLLVESSDPMLSIQAQALAMVPVHMARLTLVSLCLVTSDRHRDLCCSTIGVLQQRFPPMVCAFIAAFGTVLWAAVMLTISGLREGATETADAGL